MKNNMRFGLIILAFQSLLLQAQSSSEIRRAGIRKMTYQMVKSDSSGKDITTIETYDRKGRLLEQCEIEAKKAGAVCSRYTYSKRGKLMEECIYIGGMLDTKIVYEYNGGGHRIAKTRTDDNGKLKGRETTEWNVWGEKSSESVFDSDNMLKKKTVYEYNTRNLLVKRTIMDGNGKLLSEKKFEYEYFQ